MRCTPCRHGSGLGEERSQKVGGCTASANEFFRVIRIFREKRQRGAGDPEGIRIHKPNPGRTLVVYVVSVVTGVSSKYEAAILCEGPARGINSFNSFISLLEFPKRGRGEVFTARDVYA